MLPLRVQRLVVDPVPSLRVNLGRVLGRVIVGRHDDRPVLDASSALSHVGCTEDVDAACEEGDGEARLAWGTRVEEVGPADVDGEDLEEQSGEKDLVST